MKSKRLPPEARGALLLNVALREARKCGLANLTRDRIAAAAGVSAGLVSHRLGTMVNIRRDVMRHAVAAKDLRVVAEGLATRNPIALKAPEELRAAAAASMA